VRLYLLAAVPFFFLLAFPDEKTGTEETFLGSLLGTAYYQAVEPPFSPHEAPPAEVVGDSTARAAWLEEQTRSREQDAALAEAMDADVRAGFQRVIDILSMVVGIVMVPLLGLIVGLGMRSKEPYVAGLIFSLHLHTVAYLMAAVSWAAGAGFGPGFTAGGVYLIAARMHLKGESIPYATVATLGIAAAYLVSFIYLCFLVVWLLAYLAPGWTFGV
jgi:hypothetical protein